MPGGHQRLTESAGKKAACPVRPRTRPCGTQEGGSSCAATHPPLRHARGRLVLCGHAPALAARKRAACPVRPRTGSSCPATDRLVLSGHGPACPVRSRTRTGGQPIALRARAAVRPAFLSAAPFKAVELRSTPRKLLKKFDQNFFAPPASLFRPCGTQEGGSSRAATHPPLRHARRRLVPSGHGPACPVRPRTAYLPTQNSANTRSTISSLTCSPVRADRA